MLSESLLTPEELKIREKIVMGMKKNKSKLVKKFGKDAEKIIYGRATNMARKKSKESPLVGDSQETQLREAIRNIISSQLNKSNK